MTEIQTPLASVAPDMEVDKVEQAMYSFNFSDFLQREYRFGLDPKRPSCKAYMQGHCPLGNRCPDRHHVSSSYNKYVGCPPNVYCPHKLTYAF
jgi:cleavage and polyadenylation specificity factor subunit 4